MKFKAIQKKGWLVLCLIASFLLVYLPDQPAKAEEETKIVTSFYPMYALTKEIVGEKHPVYMINSANGIHGFEPSANDVMAIYDADIFIYHSDILESWAKKIKHNVEKQKESDVIIIEASNGLAMEKVPGLEDLELMEGKDESTLYDPHTWLDPIEIGQEAQLIAQALGQVDGENANLYSERAAKIESQAQALTEKYTPMFKALKQKTFVTQHTAFSYLATRFGLTQLGIAGVSGQEPSVKQLQEVKKFVDKYQVKTIFTEPNISDKASHLIAQETGAAVEILDPLEADPHNDLSLLANLEKNLQKLWEVLKNEGEK
ncbi:metal ABC transporter solute-binding protein, Zn/Mn family [Facklamia miroungae]|uniref:Zinc transport system substrate-binding protein n=1 Tax=Facklamia miroungae TaxID=120956 RepID=A0A1G7TAC7_9LACT|nr:zinc ABC transporter substrate-binding protein [Facklamia miroungae]NKZ29739.1 zinc ABC transporter solute-binding protein [Facklamia miroungae]SDG32307.1 zinc transport system substrate-binding protein [Facklamia miroungae]